MSEQDATLSTCLEFIESSGIDKNDGGWKTRLPTPPLLPFEDDKSYFWDVGTNKGELRIKLWPQIAPMHVSSTIYLTTLGFYDGLSFHRVIQGFMAQGGCPLGNGQGGPGYNIACECYEPNHRQHFRGTLSMAHAGRDTGGSQFFLTFVPTDHLNGKHTAFGRVIEGMDVLGKIRRIEPGGTKKEAPDKIVKMEVTRKRPGTEYAPKKVQ